MSLAPLLATAQAVSAAPGATSSGGDFFLQMVPLLLVFVIFYVLMIRPQQARVKKHQAEIAGVKKGDEVVTGGGLRGRVTRVSDGEVEVEIAQGVRVRAVTSTLTSVGSRDAKPAND